MALPAQLAEFLHDQGASGSLAAEIAGLYEDQSSLDADVMRLLTAVEAVTATLALRNSWLSLPNEILILWTDDNSNYAGAFVCGDFAPRVLVIDHEEPEMTPRFFSPAAFSHAQHAAAREGKGWYEMECDYPVLTEGPYPLREADTKLGMNHLQLYEQNTESRTQSAYHAMALLPPDRSGAIRGLLASEDMWVQARACEVLGARNDKSSIGALCEVALRGQHNGRIAAIKALRRMTWEEAREALLQLRPKLGREFSPYFSS